MAKPISQQIEEYKNAITANRQEAEAIRQTAKESNSWKTGKSSPQTGTEGRKLDLQFKRQEAAAPKPKTAAQKRDQAKRLYDDYLKSDEYKQNQVKNLKAQTDEWMTASLHGSAAYTPGDHRDKKELQLKAMVDHYTEEARKEEEAALMAKDQKELEGMEEGDRAALDTYTINRNLDFANRMNPLTDPGFGTADLQAAQLLKKHGRGKVQELAESRERAQNAELAKQAAQAGWEGVNRGTGSAVGHNIASVGANAVGGLTGLFAYLQELGSRTGRYQTMDKNNIGTLPGVYADAVRSQTAENISGDVYDENGNLNQDGGRLRQLGAYAYQGGMSAVDSLTRAALGGGAAGGAALAATGSFTRTMQEASSRGATPAEAALMATATAGIEYLSEKIPLENLVDAAKAGGHGAREIVKNALLQAGVEATTEEISLIASTLAEAAILREKGGQQQRINELMASGLRPEVAEAKAFAELMQEAKETAIVSALSGGMSEAGAAVVGNAVHRETGRPNTAAQQENADAYNPKASEEQVAAETPAPDEDLTDMDMLLEGIRQEQEDQRLAAEDDWMRQTFEEEQKKTDMQKADADRTANRQRRQEVYGDLQAAKRQQRDLQKQIEKAERKLRDSGRGSQARIDQLKAELERQNGLAAQIESQMDYFDGDYERTVGEAAARQETIFEDARAAAQRAIADHSAGRITDAQLQAAQQAYNNAGQELHRLKNMTQEQYRAELAEVGLIADNPEAQKNTPRQTMPRESGSSRTEDAPAQQMQTYRRAPTAVNSAIERNNESRPRFGDTGNRLQTDARNMQADASNGQETSPEGGQVKGTGAAEHNFSGKADYQQLLYEGNVQPDRAGDVRPMELPNRDFLNRNVSAVTGNVYGSRNTPDDLASAMEEPTARGDFSYIRITNDEATERAGKRIESAGSWQAARDDFRLDVERGRAGAELSARGALILNHAAEAYEQAKAAGNEQQILAAKQEWLAILGDVRKLGTNTAQGLQAMRIIRSLMPQDKLEFAKAAVRNMMRDMRLNVDIQIDEGLLDEYENAQTDQQRDEIMEKIQQNVADQIPSTAMDKWNALRYTNMLGNLKTQVRNIAGNAGNAAVYRMKDTTAAAIEAIVNRASGGRTGRTKSVIVSRDLKKACADYYSQVKAAISSGGKYGEGNAATTEFEQAIMDKRRIFKSPMEKYRRATDWAMNNKYFGDEAFGKAAFTRAMAGYLQANGVKPGTDLKTVNRELMDKAMAHAVTEAQEATFHDNSALARVLGKVKKDTGVLGEGIMPFTRTPANVLTRAEEFSPLGLINTAVMAARKAAGSTTITDGNSRVADWARSGQDITGTDIVNSLAKTLTGTGLFALGAIMKSQGLITGGPDEDEEKAAFDQLNGYQDYAIVLPGGITYTMDWLTPAAMPMFMGAQLMDIAGERRDLTFADLEQVFTSIAEPMLQMSMLQGLSDSLDNIKYSDNNLGQFVINAAVNYLTQGLTNTLLGQMERSTEDTRQTTYVDPDSDVPKWLQRQLGKASQKIPGWDYQQTDYIDARGQTEQQPTGALGWLYNLASPGYVDRVEVDALSKELYRLNEAGVEGNVFPQIPETTVTYTDREGNAHRDEHLTAQQAEILKRETGQRATRIANDLIRSEEYAAMSDAQKAKAIQEIYRYAKEAGEIAAVGDSHEGFSSAWMEELEEGKEAEYIARKVTGGDINEAMSALFTAWNKGYDDSSRSDDLEWAYETFQAMDKEAKAEVKDRATGTAAKYIEAREKGIPHDTFLRAAENAAKAKGTGTNGNVRDIDRWEAIARTGGLSEKAADTLMRCYMPDYDPDAKSKDYTELKYNYIRQELGLSAKEYAATYRAHLDNSQKADKIAAIMAMGYDRKTATALYNVYQSTDKGKAAYMSLYED